MKRAGRAFALLIGLLAFAMPAVAAAHVRLQPEKVEAGVYTVLHVNVPNESPDLATTKVVLEFPPGFTYALYRPVAGWSGEVTVTKRAKSIIGSQTTPEGVARMTWTARQPGAEIQPDQFEEFPIAVQIPDTAGETLTFKATQTYENGDVVRWVGGPSSQEPAPQVFVAVAGVEQGGAVGEDGPVEENSEDGSDGLAIAALILGILGLVAGVTALVRSVRATRGTLKASEKNEMASESEVISGDGPN